MENRRPRDANGSNITAGPYKGLKGIITKYPITITARSVTGNAEVRLRREMQTVAVPVFQFGVFSETDLTFYAGDNFDFGGRVHTNGNLFLSNVARLTLTFTDYITAVQGGRPFAFLQRPLGFGRTASRLHVLIPTAIGTTTRNHAAGRGQRERRADLSGLRSGATCRHHQDWLESLVDRHVQEHHPQLQERRHAARSAVGLQGASPIDLIRRPPEDEDIDNPQVYSQRFYLAGEPADSAVRQGQRTSRTCRR